MMIKHLLFHVLLTLAILLTACTSGSAPAPELIAEEAYPITTTTQSPPAEGYPVDTPTPSAPPSITASLPPYPFPTLPVTPAPSWERSRVGDAQLITVDLGWALDEERLMWTGDAGESWREITPPVSADFTIADVFFLNANLGWVAASPALAGDQAILPVQIMRTEDGGQSWQSYSFEASLPYPVNARPTQIEFIDPQHGWLVVDRTATMNSSAADLYESSDGGITWNLKSLPFSGPVHFISPSVGRTTGSCCTGAPKQLYRTTDGGLTWQQQVVAPDPVEDDFDYHDYGLPVFQNEQEGVLAITLRDVNYEVTGLGFYRTSDAGQSWQLAETFTTAGPVPIGAGNSIPVQILNPEHWIVALPGALHVTRDGGETWEEFGQADLPGSHVRLEFVNEATGWSLVFEDNCGDDCLLLFKSTDGGKTWSAVAVANGGAPYP